MAEQTSLGLTMKSIVEAVLTNMYTSLPCKVVEYYPQSMRADVIPMMLLKDPLSTEATYKPSQLSNLPVIFPDDGDVYVRNPLKPGNLVMVSFSAVALDVLLSLDSPGDPVSKRRFSMKDGFVLGSYRFDSGTETSSDNSESFLIHRRSTDTTFAIDPEGNVAIAGVKTFSVNAENISLEAAERFTIFAKDTDIVGEDTMYIRGKDVALEGTKTTISSSEPGTISGKFAGGAITSSKGVSIDDHVHDYTDDGKTLTTKKPTQS